MGSKVGRSARRDHLGRTFRDQRVIAHADYYEYLLISIAARMLGENITDFVRDAAVNMAMVAIDTGRKLELAKAKGLKLYGQDIPEDL